MIMKRILTLFLLVIGLSAGSLSMAQGSDYSLNWWTVDGGGGLSGDGRYALQATGGQYDAGEMEDGRYTLHAGYWDSASPYALYLPVMMQP